MGQNVMTQEELMAHSPFSTKLWLCPIPQGASGRCPVHASKLCFLPPTHSFPLAQAGDVSGSNGLLGPPFVSSLLTSQGPIRKQLADPHQDKGLIKGLFIKVWAGCRKPGWIAQNVRASIAEP